MNTISFKSILICAFLVGTLISCGGKKEEIKEEVKTETQNVETTTNEAQQATTSEKITDVTGELRLDKNIFEPREIIKLSFQVSKKLDDKPWIGIIPSEIPHGNEAENDLHDIDYKYFDNQESGTLEFTAPANVGKYDFRMHTTDNTGVEITSISFEVK